MSDNGALSGRRKPIQEQHAIAYGHVCGRQLRPNGSRPISSHRAVGGLLQSVLAATAGRKGVQDCVNMIRGDLDEWVMREFTVELLDQQTFLSLYYGADDRQSFRPIDDDEIVTRLVLVKEILARHYPDCGPLRLLLKFADRAIALICTRRVRAQVFVGGSLKTTRSYPPTDRNAA